MNSKQPERKVLAILAIIFGGIGIVLSWIPVVNNIAMVFGIIGLILGIIALVINIKHRKILTIIGTLLGAATIIIVLSTQAMYSNAMNRAEKDFNESTKTTASSSRNSSSEKNSTESSSDSSSSSSNEVSAIGENVDVTNGLRFKVNNVQYNNGSSASTPDSGKTYVIVNVTLSNIGKKPVDYDETDFDISDNGNRVDMDEDNIQDDNYNDEIQNVMNAGTLDPGATITVNLIGQAVRTDKLQFVYTGEYNNGEIKVALN